MPPSRLEDNAMIGDCQTAALVAKDGSIDWLCLPRFDSAVCFAAFIGAPDHGRWRIAPAGAVHQARRCYRENTLVLESEYTTHSSCVRIIDFMPVRTREPDLIRIVEGCEGEVRMELDSYIRFEYGSVVPWVRRQPQGIRATAGPDTVFVYTDVDLHGSDMHTAAEFTVRAGQRMPFTVLWRRTYESPPKPSDPFQQLDATEAWRRRVWVLFPEIFATALAHTSGACSSNCSGSI
jgi:GH15 family glucan-1,4-alpha-glucosidase